MSNGVSAMVNHVIARLNRSRSLALLRIHSPGVAGPMNVSAGAMPGTRQHAGIGIGNLPTSARRCAASRPASRGTGRCN